MEKSLEQLSNEILSTVASTLAREAEIAIRLKNSAADQTWVVMYEAVWM